MKDLGKVARVDLAERLIHRILLKYRGRRILDVGCGFGSLALMFKKKYPDAEVIGTDINPDYIRVAKRRAEDTGLDVRFLVHDACRPNRLGAFDLIVSKSSFCYWKEPRKALKALEKNLSDDGVVVIMDALGDSLVIRLLLRSKVMRFFDIEEDGFPDYVRRLYSWDEAREFFGKSMRKEFLGVYFLVELNRQFNYKKHGPY